MKIQIKGWIYNDDKWWEFNSCYLRISLGWRFRRGSGLAIIGGMIPVGLRLLGSTVLDGLRGVVGDLLLTLGGDFDLVGGGGIGHGSDG